MAVSSCSKHHPAPVQDASGKAVVQIVQPVLQQEKKQSKYVTVKKGDTLYSIGFTRSMDYKYLAQINNIKSPYSIYPGQKLRLQSEKPQVNKIAETSKASTVVSTHAVIAQQPKFTPIVSKETSSVPAQIVKQSKKIKPIVKPIVKVNRPSKVVIKKPNVKSNIKVSKKQPNPNQPVTQLNAQWKWPLKGRILSTFLASDVSRKGIDIAAKPKTPVFASQNGVVVYSGDGLRGYGELIIIKHSNNLLSAYAHNSSRLVKEGVTVKQGQIIAKSGKGTDGQGLLHFEIRKNGQPVNPLKYLPK